MFVKTKLSREKIELFREKWRIELYWLHLMLPFIASFILIMLLFFDRVLIMEDNYLSFLRDTSNSICLLLFFTLSYYLAANYHSWAQNALTYLECLNGKEKTYNPDKKKTVHIFIIVMSIMVLLVIICYSTASMPSQMWAHYLSTKTKVFYNLYLWATAVLGGYILVIACFSCHNLAKELDNLDIKEINGNITSWELVLTFHEISRVLGVTIAYASIYIMGGALIVFNDYKNYIQYNVNLFFHKCPIIIIILLLFIIAAIVYMMIPVIKYTKKSTELKIWKLQSSTCHEDTDIIQKISTSILSSTISKITLFISTIVPILAGILGIIEIFPK